MPKNTTEKKQDMTELPSIGQERLERVERLAEAANASAERAGKHLQDALGRLQQLQKRFADLQKAHTQALDEARKDRKHANDTIAATNQELRKMRGELETMDRRLELDLEPRELRRRISGN